MTSNAARLSAGPRPWQGETLLCAAPNRPDNLAGPRPASSAAPAHSSEAELLSAAANGRQPAFQQLVQLHAPAALAIARRMLGDDAEAEDVVQEAMLRLWHNAASIEIGPFGLRPWLRRVVSNLSIDRIRAGRGTIVTDDVPERATAARQERDIDERDVSARVDAAIAALPERQRLALTLFHYEGASQNETAEIMGISAEAVESLLARARRTLRVALANEWRELLPDGSDIE